MAKLQNLLQQSRDEMLELCNKHDTDMKLMMDRLHIKSDDAFVKFKQTAISNVNQPPAGAPSSKQVSEYYLCSLLVRLTNHKGANIIVPLGCIAFYSFIASA